MPVLIEELSLRGLLSFGLAPVTLPLRALNVVVGINGSGKTNLLDCLDLLHRAPIDPLVVPQNKGGAAAWRHGLSVGDGLGFVEVVLGGMEALPALRYQLGLRFGDSDVSGLEESLEARDPQPGQDTRALFLRSSNGRASVKLRDPQSGRGRWARPEYRSTALAALRGNPHCPELTHVAGALGGIQLWQGWTFGPRALVRQPVSTGLSAERLESDGSNLPLLLRRLRDDGATWTRLRETLQKLYPRIDDVEISSEGNAVKLLLREAGLPVPAARISDGTLRWLCLLALLLDPQPAPLLCLEEPELGLHPDLIGTLAELLRDASQRTQILCTTHSPALISEFSPADVVVCEKENGGSTLKRLDPEELAVWLEEYSLGNAWMRGAFGGTRW